MPRGIYDRTKAKPRKAPAKKKAVAKKTTTRTRGTTGGKRTAASEAKEVAKLRSRANHPTARKPKDEVKVDIQIDLKDLVPTTDGGKSSTELKSDTRPPKDFRREADRLADMLAARKQGGEDAIYEIWASAQTNDALLMHLERYMTEPKGWKKAHKNAMLAEVYRRFEAMIKLLRM